MSCRYLCLDLGDRLTVGHEPLKLSILVRFQVPQVKTEIDNKRPSEFLSFGSNFVQEGQQ